jgi:hypothetical protein
MDKSDIIEKHAGNSAMVEDIHITVGQHAKKLPDMGVAKDPTDSPELKTEKSFTKPKVIIDPQEEEKRIKA